MSDDTLGAGPADKPLPAELAGALNARSEDDVTQQPTPGEVAACKRVDTTPGYAVRVAQASAADRIMSVLGPGYKSALAGLLLVGFKVIELTADEKRQVQAQLIEVAREAKPAEKPNVLKMVPRRRIIRPGD